MHGFHKVGGRTGRYEKFLRAPTNIELNERKKGYASTGFSHHETYEYAYIKVMRPLLKGNALEKRKIRIQNKHIHNRLTKCIRSTGYGTWEKKRPTFTFEIEEEKRRRPAEAALMEADQRYAKVTRKLEKMLLSWDRLPKDLAKEMEAVHSLYMEAKAKNHPGAMTSLGRMYWYGEGVTDDRELAKKLWTLQTVNLRDYGIGPHKKVDDTPAGGGSGLVIRADVLEPALEKSISNYPNGRPLIYMSPRGKPFEQRHAKKWAAGPGVIILCGRFEGIDERILESYDIEEISLGDFVMTGGEIAAQAIIDTTVRLLPGVLGNPESIVDESHTSGLLEYPQYTKPSEWKNKKVPEILLSGHHENIAKWRLNQSIATTKKNRPDLWKAWNISQNKPNLKD